MGGIPRLRIRAAVRLWSGRRAVLVSEDLDPETQGLDGEAGNLRCFAKGCHCKRPLFLVRSAYQGALRRLYRENVKISRVIRNKSKTFFIFECKPRIGPLDSAAAR